MESENYIPTPKEEKEAQGSMSYSQALLSFAREKTIGREKFDAKDILDGIKESAQANDIRILSSLLLEKEKQIKHVTILRGENSTGTGESGQMQSFVSHKNFDGKDKSDISVFGQVYIAPHLLMSGEKEQGAENDAGVDDSPEKNSHFVFHVETVSSYENKEEEFQRIILHELAHLFTAYIINWHSKAPDKLNNFERDFYDETRTLFDEFSDENPEKEFLWGNTPEKNLNEFFAFGLTGSGVLFEEYKKELQHSFKKLYINNTRMINSITEISESV